MTEHHTPTLDDVLNEYVTAVPEPDHAALQQWIARYPQFARELTEFTVAWSMSEVLPASPDVQQIPDEVLVRRGLDIVHEVLARQDRETIANLVQEGRKHHLTPAQLAAQARLSPTLLRILDRRLIRFSSIPRAAIEQLAAALKRDAAAVIAYLQQPPTLAQGTSYYSEQKPELGEQQDFFAAVESDKQMNDEQRAYWLAQRPQGE